MIEVRIRYFASLADRCGCAEESIRLDPGTDLERLWARLVERHPELGRLGFRPLVACDREYAEWSRTVEGVREVAFLPPVSGG